MSFSLRPATALLDRFTRYWWLVLLTGVAWIVVAVIVFRFDYSSVRAVAWLFGWVAIAVGATSSRWRRWRKAGGGSSACCSG
jgi:uncharacterized membrane protein HdeD (DUF308 family)